MKVEKRVLVLVLVDLEVLPGGSEGGKRREGTQVVVAVTLLLEQAFARVLSRLVV